MVRRVSSAEAELHLAAPMDEVAAGDTEIIIEQQGRPLAALVSIKRLEAQPSDVALPTPADDPMLALVGSWGDVGDDAIDEMVAQIYEARDRDQPRPIDLPE